MARFSVYLLLASAVLFYVSITTLASEELLDAELEEWLDEEALVQDLHDVDLQLRDFNSFKKKLQGCVNRVDKSRLKEQEKKILVKCILPALKGPLNPQAIASRYALCVVKKNVSGPAKEAAQQVAGCMRS